MIRIIDSSKRASFETTLATMFEDRKRLFVDLLGWNVPVVCNRYEMDDFDGPGSIYVADIDEAGRHQGSLRLLPSTKPHILGDLFPQLCPAGVPRGESTFEITRLCLPSRHGADRRLAIRNALISAMVDHALGCGVTRLTGVVEDRFRKEILAMGWLAEPLGPAVRIDGTSLGAFAVHLAADTPDRLRWTGTYVTNAGLQAAGAVA